MFREGDVVHFKNMFVKGETKVKLGRITKITPSNVYIEDFSNGVLCTRNPSEIVRNLTTDTFISSVREQAKEEPIPKVPEGYIMISENLLKKLIGQELFDEFKACMQYNER